jgi:hypothetical protein
LVDFVTRVCPLRRAADFRPLHAERFVRSLRTQLVAPNGHPHAKRRRLRDSGIKFILETCAALLNYAARNRYLPPYADNPFRLIEIHRITVRHTLKQLANHR